MAVDRFHFKSFWFYLLEHVQFLIVVLFLVVILAMHIVRHDTSRCQEHLRFRAFRGATPGSVDHTSQHALTDTDNTGESSLRHQLMRPNLARLHFRRYLDRLYGFRRRSVIEVL